MATLDSLVAEILEVEERYNLNKINISGIPAWPILKYRLRGHYLISKGVTDITLAKNNKTKRSIRSVKYWFISLFQLLSLLFSKKNVKYCFVGFTRLENVNNKRIDKFFDPIIKCCELEENDYLYFNNEISHPADRSDEHPIVYTDIIRTFSLLCGVIISPFVYLLNKKEFQKLNNVTTDYFTKDKKAKLYSILKICSFTVQRVMYRRIFKNTKPGVIIGVSRITFLPQALAAKSVGIKVVEMQHGITLGRTPQYSGEYNPKIDPDVFCAFGNSCPLDVFGIDPLKIVNVGWALKSYLKTSLNVEEFDPNYVLFISDPEISDYILSTVLKLASMHPDVNFHIRRHPQERYGQKQITLIDDVQNVKDVTSTECSQIAIMRYKYIVGENSSVVFEAISAGKMVARLNCEGMTAMGYNPSVKDGFYYINEIGDFEEFINQREATGAETVAYSDFNTIIFKSVINN